MGKTLMWLATRPKGLLRWIAWNRNARLALETCGVLEWALEQGYSVTVARHGERGVRVIFSESGNALAEIERAEAHETLLASADLAWVLSKLWNRINRIKGA